MDQSSSSLHQIHPHKLRWRAAQHDYFVLGSLPEAFHTLEITLRVMCRESQRSEWSRVDLFKREAVERLLAQWALRLEASDDRLRDDLLTLTALLEDWRDQQWQASEQGIIPAQAATQVSQPARAQARALAQSQDFLHDLDQLLDQAGLVAPSIQRQLLWLCGSTYLSPQPLHLALQGSGGACSQDLIQSLLACFPEANMLALSRITSHSLYHYKPHQLREKALWVESLDDLDRQAQKALIQIMKRQRLDSSSAFKDAQGHIHAQAKAVEAHCSLLFGSQAVPNELPGLLSLNLAGQDSQAQQWQHKIQQQLSGQDGSAEMQRARQALRQFLSELPAVRVANPFSAWPGFLIAGREGYRLTYAIHCLASHLARLQQAQRPQNSQGQIITSPDDLRQSAHLIYRSGQIAQQRLPESQRALYQGLQRLSTEQSAGFSAKEAQQALHLSRSKFYRGLSTLIEQGLVEKGEGDSHNGYRYHIAPQDEDSAGYQSLMKQVEHCIAQSTAKTPTWNTQKTQRQHPSPTVPK